jgi:hypothetical protein
VRHGRFGQGQGRAAGHDRRAQQGLAEIEGSEQEKQSGGQAGQQAGNPLVHDQAGGHDQAAHDGCGDDMGRPRYGHGRQHLGQGPALTASDEHKRQPVGRQGRVQEGRGEADAQDGQQDGLLEVGRHHRRPS